MENLKINKQPIYFDEIAYEKHMTTYNQKQKLLKEIKVKMNSFFPALEYNIDELFPNTMEVIYSFVEKVYLQSNPMGLTGRKLAELKEMDFSLLLKDLKDYEGLKDLAKPTKSQHTTFAETPEEIDRLNMVMSFIKSINTFLGQETYNLATQTTIRGLTKGAVVFPMNSIPRPNTNYVKNIEERNY